MTEEEIIGYIDDREASKHNYDKLSYKMIVQRLDTGDITFPCLDLGIEIKTYPDMFASIIDGRIYSQLEGLKLFKYRYVIIVRGNYRLEEPKKKAISTISTQLTMFFGINVLWVDDFFFLQYMINKMVSMIKDPPEFKDKFNVKNFTKVFSIKDRKIAMITCAEGFGNKISEKVIEKYDTIDNLIKANKEDLKSIRLVGDTRAENLYKLLHE